MATAAIEAQSVVPSRTHAGRRAPAATHGSADAEVVHVPSRYMWSCSSCLRARCVRSSEAQPRLLTMIASGALERRPDRNRYVLEDGVERSRAAARDAEGTVGRPSRPSAFADALPAHVRAIPAMAIALSYSAKPLPDERRAPNGITRRIDGTWYGLTEVGFDPVRRLDGNIGSRSPARPYARLRCGRRRDDTARTSAALIRPSQNGGGHGDMAHLLPAYPGRIKTDIGSYDRTERHAHWSLRRCGCRAGDRFGPAFLILMSGRRSRAEGFTYYPKRDRVTVLGGGAERWRRPPVQFRRVHPHFVLSWLRTLHQSPTGGNWQGTGVLLMCMYRPTGADVG